MENIVVDIVKQVKTCAEFSKRKKAIKGRILESWVMDFELKSQKQKQKIWYKT